MPRRLPQHGSHFFSPSDKTTFPKECEKLEDFPNLSFAPNSSGLKDSAPLVKPFPHEQSGPIGDFPDVPGDHGFQFIQEFIEFLVQEGLEGEYRSKSINFDRPTILRLISYYLLDGCMQYANEDLAFGKYQYWCTNNLS